MKKQYRIISLCITILACMVAIISCKKDDKLNTKELLAYIKAANVSSNTNTLSVIVTPSGATAGDSVSNKLTGYLTRPLGADVTITVSADDAKLAEYNQANKTNLVLLPSTAYKLTGGGNIIIKAGEATSADSIQVQLTDRSKLTDANGYLLPLSITKVNNNIQASSNFGTIYVRVNITKVNIDPTNTIPSGTNIDRLNPIWKVTTSTAYLPANNMLDGNPATAWDSNTGTETVILDMGVMQNGIKGILISPNYVYNTDNILNMEVYSSADGTNWVKTGDWKATNYPPLGSASNPQIQAVKFYSPVDARYFKFITSGTSYVGIGELNVVK